jgi:uncharacterized cupredoxin-like copper-binding protein
VYGHTHPRRAALTVAVAAALAASGMTVAASAGQPRRVAAKLGEYSIKLDRGSVSHGRVSFTIRNDGKAVHEFIVLKSSLQPDALPRNGSKVNEGSAGRVIDEVEDIKPGRSATLTLNLKAGRYVLLCNLAGHYPGGMHAGLRVK